MGDRVKKRQSLASHLLISRSSQLCALLVLIVLVMLLTVLADPTGLQTLSAWLDVQTSISSPPCFVTVPTFQQRGVFLGSSFDWQGAYLISICKMFPALQRIKDNQESRAKTFFVTSSPLVSFPASSGESGIDVDLNELVLVMLSYFIFHEIDSEVSQVPHRKHFPRISHFSYRLGKFNVDK